MAEYADPGNPKYAAMVERIRQRLNLTTLKYQRLEDLVAAIGLPKCKLCTYCWDGVDNRKGEEPSLPFPEKVTTSPAPAPARIEKIEQVKAAAKPSDGRNGNGAIRPQT